MNNPNESQTRPVELPRVSFIARWNGRSRGKSTYRFEIVEPPEGIEFELYARQHVISCAERYAAAETKRADALAVRVKELEAERDQHRARADAIESAANEVKFDYYYDLPAEVSKLFDGAKTLTVLNMPTIRKLRSLLKAFDAERGDAKGDCDA